MKNNKIRCNNCEGVFYEKYVKGTNTCPICGIGGYLMDVPKNEFPVRKGKNAYPIIGKCKDFNILINNLDDEDLNFIEETLTQYEKSEIDMLLNKDGIYVFAENNQIKFGGLKLSVLKWFESLITTEDLINEITTLPF